MKSIPGGQDEQKATFSFYNGYLAVVYGLLVTDGLHYVVTFTGDAKHDWNPLDAFLFLGTFLVSLHFWYACATVDNLSKDFYNVLTGANASFFDFLLLIDAIVATAFAGFMLAMFQAIPPEQTRFFLWFLCASGLGLLYDLNSCFLVWYARRTHNERSERETIESYGEKVTNWIIVDLIVAIGAASMYRFYSASEAGYRFVFGFVFTMLTVFLLLTDIYGWPFRSYYHRKQPSKNTV